MVRPFNLGLRVGAPFVMTIGVLLAAASGLPAWTQSAPETTPVAPVAVTAAPSDPWNRFNRRSFASNRFLDRVLVGPVVRAYIRVTPRPIRRGLGNVVSNLREPGTVLNHVLQGHPKRAVQATARFVTNSTVGVLGVFDVATAAGLEKNRADFGQTLGRYGAGPGPYLYLPLVGPLNVRDGVGSVVDAFTDPVSLATGGLGSDFGVGRLAVSAVDARAAAEATLEAITQEATDPYATIRSAYAQNREAVVREATGEVEALPDFEAPPEDDSTPAVEEPTVPQDVPPGGPQ